MSILYFYVLFVCKCVLYYCHRVPTQLQLNKYIISKTLLHRSYRLVGFHQISEETLYQPSKCKNEENCIVWWIMFPFIYKVQQVCNLLVPGRWNRNIYAKCRVSQVTSYTLEPAVQSQHKILWCFRIFYQSSAVNIIIANFNHLVQSNFLENL
jgi:hypothetical protein